MSKEREELRKEFEQVVKPLIAWINNRFCDPRTQVIVDTISAEVVTGNMAITTTEFLKD